MKLYHTVDDTGDRAWERVFDLKNSQSRKEERLDLELRVSVRKGRESTEGRHEGTSCPI